ncbi:MAG: serine hydrolase domain-containing protein [Thalassobaculum sp.]|uniref:serine hydrolase domain-containing protein n=1 Tax=Thalassobaculum sp. TaxID=2022740 RepID=UPI0032F088BC
MPDHTAPAFPEQPDAALATRLDAVLDDYVGGSIVGAVVIVARDGKIAYRRAAGHADRESGRAMTADTPFRLASVTKPYVTVAALALVDRGILELDAPISRWLPDFRPHHDGAEATITLRHLLSHTSGLGYGFFQKADGPYLAAGISDGIDRPGFDLAENLRRLAGVPLNFAPGSAWLYSLATDVLGAVLQAATGRPLAEVVRDQVTGPLGLTGTGFHAAEPDALATAYADAPGGPARMDDPHAVSFGEGGAIRFAPSRAGDAAAYPSGGAGMVGTPGDFLALLEALRTGGAPVLRPETVAALTTNTVGTMAEQGIGAGWGFGLGVAVLVDPAAAATPQAAGTWRWGGVYGHNWFVDPAAGLVVTTFTNTAVSGMNGPIREAVRDAVYGAG